MIRRLLSRLRPTPRAAPPPRPYFEELEQRILYSADLAPTAAADLPGWAPDAEVRQLDTVLSASEDAAQVEQSIRHEIVFVDEQVPNAQRLIEALRANSDPGVELRVLVIGAEEDGIDVISRALAERPGLVDAVHLISHGDDGLLRLGSAPLDGTTLEARGDQLRTWGLSLGPEADILIYGCEVAASDQGLQLVERIAQLTGADVAASDDLTGSASLGADWVLEATVGRVEANTLRANEWAGTLALSTTGTWGISGGTATNTTDGVTTTITLSPDDPNSSFTTTANDTLNTIPAFTPDVGGNASLLTRFGWDVSPEPGSEAAVDATTGTITITFSQAVTNPVFHIDKIGGSDSGLQNASILTLLTPGITLTRLSGTPHFTVDSDAGTIGNDQVDVATGFGHTAESSMTANKGTAAGSVRLNGTFTMVSLRIAAAPNANEGTGGDAIEMAFSFNAPPVAVDDNFSTNEDTAVTFDPRSNDSDSNGDTLTVTKIDSSNITAGGAGVAVTGGSVTLGLDGQLTFTPSANYYGATSFTYTISNGNGYTATATVNGTVNAVNDAPSGLPMLTGTATEDQTLSADPSGIADADGLGAFAYQWLRDGVAVVGATASTYTLGDADVGRLMSVRLSYTDAYGANEVLSSLASAAVANLNDLPVGLPAISGPLISGQTLSATASDISDLDGLGPMSFQWRADGIDIAGATGMSYTLSDADAGKSISVLVRYTDAWGTLESVSSPASGSVQRGPSFEAEHKTNAETTDDGVYKVPDLAHQQDTGRRAPAIQLDGEGLDVEARLLVRTGGVFEGASDALNIMVNGAGGSRGQTDLLASLSMTEYQLVLRPLLVTYQSAQIDAADYSSGDMNALEGKWLQDEMDLRIDSVRLVGLAFSAGVVAWALRVGGMIASLLATVPAWRNFDPMPIMPEEDQRKGEAWQDESGADKGAGRNANVEMIERQKEGERP